MSKRITGRMTVEFEGDFVVFIVGMSINRFWKFWKWFPVAMAMPKMLKELSADSSLGLLGIRSGGFGTVIQYWRSFEHLERYAKNPDKVHLPAWREFNRRIRGNGDVGIWHETFLVRNGEYECIYSNVPKRGMAVFAELVPATGKRESAKGRVGESA